MTDPISMAITGKDAADAKSNVEAATLSDDIKSFAKDSIDALKPVQIPQYDEEGKVTGMANKPFGVMVRIARDDFSTLVHVHQT